MRAARLFQARGASGAVAVQALAALPPLAVTAWQGGAPVLATLAMALLVALAWDYAFAALRKRRFEPFGITTALIFTLFAPDGLSPWHLAALLSLACVIGELVFGGRGFAFLSPATVALALILLSLPDLSLRLTTPQVALVCLPGAALLLWAGLLNLRIALAFLVALGLLAGIATGPEALALLSASAAALVFLLCDPTSVAVTPSGRIVHGVLAGGLAFVFGGFTAAPPETDALVLSALLASLFAPLIDHGAVRALGPVRIGRHG